MDRALWLLYWLGFRSWLRRSLRNLRTVKGMVSAGIWLLILGPCMVSWIASISGMRAPANLTPGISVSLEQVERYGSLGLLALCLLTLATASGKGAVVVFLPAEIAFLVAGPFTRRQLLAYKLLSVLLVICVTSLFYLILLALGSFLNLPAGPQPARYFGIVLLFIFLQLLALDLISLALIVGAHAYSRARKIMLWTLGILALAALLYASMNLPRLGWAETLERLERMPAARVLLEVPRWFVRASLVERYWPDFVTWGGASLAVDMLLLLLLFKLDAHYIEGAAAAGERLYANIQRIRTQGASAVLIRSSGTARSSVRSLPWWGGVGPLAWRQIQCVARSRFLLSLFLLAPLGLVIFANIAGKGMPSGHATDIFLASEIVVLSLIAPGMFAFDFRKDFDRMDVLKSLPIGSVPLVIGQILTPVLCTTLIQVFCTAALAIRASRPDAAFLLWTVFPLVVPLNVLLVGLDNVVFLLCPSRPVNVAPAGAQFSGQKLLLNMGKFLVLNVACAMAAGLAVGAYFLTGRQLTVALAVAWLVLALFAAAVVPLLALAFQHFDVARDRPA